MVLLVEDEDEISSGERSETLLFSGTKEQFRTVLEIVLTNDQCE